MNWLQMARDVWDSSTTYVDQNYRKNWEYAIRAFQNEHAPGSKYLSEDYKARSKLFRPKTRTIIRKNEAAANIALFSNEDVIVVNADDQSNQMAVVSAEVNKALLQYRLTKTLPWFKIAMGALQESQKVGAVCSYQYWEFKEKDGKIVRDQPCIKLRPIENIRLDGGADWLDPVESSPYFIDIIPMYVCDVKAMMKSEDPKTGQPKWKQLDDEVFLEATPDVITDSDSTRRLREGAGRLNPETDQEPALKDHSIVWVMKYFIRDSDDMCFFTLGNAALLTDPKPIEEVYWHGKRPYVIGNSIIETFKPLPDGVAQLSKPLQIEANEVANQRIDNVKLVLNKRWFVARGRQVDTASLLRNVPGGVTFMNDPENDVKESNWPDVTASAYMEQDRLNVDFDELVGNFSGSSVMTNRQLNETVGGMKMISQGASVMTEYLIRTWIETWVEPVLRQVMMLEQYYETDEKVLSIAGKKAGFQYGLSPILDDLMNQEVFLTVNVGQGATDPQARMQKLVGATQAVIALVNNAPPGMNVPELTKEIYSYAGFRNGSRFMGEGDPRLLKAMQMIQQLQGQVQGKQMELQANAQVEQMKLASNEKIKGAEINVNHARIQGDLRIREAEVAIQQAELELERMKMISEAEGSTQEQQMKLAEMAAKIEDARLKIAHEAQRIENERMKQAHEIHLAEKEAQSAETNEARIGEVANRVSQAMEVVSQEISGMKGDIEKSKDNKEVSEMKDNLSALTALVMSMAKQMDKQGNKAKMTGYSINKKDGKRTGMTISFDDGTFKTVMEH